MAKVSCTKRQTVQIAALLDKYLYKSKDDDSIFEYLPEWNDFRIASMCQTDENPIVGDHVGRLRVELYGSLRRPKGASKDAQIAALVDRCDALTKKIEVFEKRIADSESLHAKLCVALTLNRVLPGAKELAGPGRTVNPSQVAVAIK